MIKNNTRLKIVLESNQINNIFVVVYKTVTMNDVRMSFIVTVLYIYDFLYLFL